VKQLGLVFCLLAVPCSAQNVANAPADSRSTRAESPSEGITREQAAAILQELRSIHQLLERQAPAVARPQAPTRVTVKLEADSQTLGRDDAPVTIVEFSDYQCPYCRRYHSAAYLDIKKNYIDTGKVRYVIRDLPLDMHPNAASAAVASHCAGDQDQFEPMRELLLAASADLSPESIVRFGQQLNLNMPKFRACLDAKEHAAQVQRDVTSAAALGINSTPSFVIGKTAKDQIDGVRIAGALSFQAFEAAIQSQAQAVSQAVK
jgi:protein-disulfide isomerase